nr:hypothetical protein [Tanacetum cinerariifolium]
MLMVQAQESGQELDEEQLAFLVNLRVANGQGTQMTIPLNVAFQTDDLDAYDSLREKFIDSQMDDMIQNNNALNFSQTHLLVRNLRGVDLLKGKVRNTPTIPKLKTPFKKSSICYTWTFAGQKDSNINGPKYILVIVDDYSRFTWIKFLQSKDEVPEFVIKFLKMIQVRLNVTVLNIKTDNGIEFVNKTLRAYYEDVEISEKHRLHALNNRTTLSKDETKLYALCYPTNDSEDLGKLKPKADIRIFTGYAPTKKAFRIYNKRTYLITKTIHDILFQPMFNEYFYPPPCVASPVPIVVASEPAKSISTPSLTHINQDAPSLSTSQTPQELQSPVIPFDVEEHFHDIEVAHLDNDPFFGVPIPKQNYEESSSRDVIPTNVHSVKLDELGGVLKNKARDQAIRGLSDLYQILQWLDTSKEKQRVRKSISLTKADEEEAARRVHATHEQLVTKSDPEPARRSTRRRPSSIEFRDTSSVSKKKSPDQSQKLKGIQTMTTEEQLATDTMQALKASKKLSRKKESEYSEENVDEEIEWLITNEQEEEKDDNEDDKSIDIEKTDDEFVHGDEYVHANVEERMKDVEVAETRKDDEEITDEEKTNAEKTEVTKRDLEQAGKLPLTSSSLSMSSGFVTPVTTLPPHPFVTNITHVLQQQRTPIPTPPITTITLVTTIPPPPPVTNITHVLQQQTTPIPTPPITNATLAATTIPDLLLTIIQRINITKPQKDFPRISTKEIRTPSFEPPRVVYEDLSHQKRLMCVDELYKFLDGTLKKVHDTLHHMLLNFRLGYNKDMPRRKWSDTDKRRSGIMVDLIDKQMLERHILRNLERLVGARELEMDYRLMQRII